MRKEQKNMERSNSIKISLKPFATLFTIVFVFIIGGSILNSVRISQKLERLKIHTGDIYNAHAEQFILQSNSNNESSIRTFLENINSPEQGLFFIGLIVKENAGWAYYARGFKKTMLTKEQIDKVNESTQQRYTSTINESVFKSIDGTESLYGFTPIFDNNNLTGYVVVRLPKTKNI